MTTFSSFFHFSAVNASISKWYLQGHLSFLLNNRPFFDSRVKTYLSSVSHNNRPEDKKLIEILTAIFVGAASLDLDGQPLTDYVKCGELPKYLRISHRRASLPRTESLGVCLR